MTDSNQVVSALAPTKYKDETAPRMFSLQRDRQSYIVKRMTEQWLPDGGSILDVTSGTLGYWWNVFEKKSLAGLYEVTKCDAEPSLEEETIHKLDLVKEKETSTILK